MRLLASLSIALLSASSMSAQVCNGNASFANGPVRVGVGARFADGFNQYGVEVAAGAPAGPFATAGFSSRGNSNVSDRSNSFELGAGYGMPLNPAKTVELCPLVGYTHHSGPSTTTALGKAEFSANAFMFGGSIGGVMSSSPQFDFIPFAGAAHTRIRATGKIGSTSSSSSDSYSQVDFGAGLVVNKLWTIRPTISFPVGEPSSDPLYGISVSVNLGSTSR